MLCVIAKLDAAATERLAALRRAVRPDAKPLYGHITLAAWTGDDERRFLASCKARLKGLAPLSVAYERIAVLPETSIVVAEPARSPALDALHRRVAEPFEDGLDPWTRTGRWRPHTTLLYDPDADLNAIARRLETAFVPFTAQIGRIEFSEVRADGYAILDGVDLKN